MYYILTIESLKCLHEFRLFAEIQKFFDCEKCFCGMYINQYFSKSSLDLEITLLGKNLPVGGLSVVSEEDMEHDFSHSLPWLPFGGQILSSQVTKLVLQVAHGPSDHPALLSQNQL